MRVLIAEPFADNPAVLGALDDLVPGLDLRIWPRCGPVDRADLLVSWKIPKALDPLPAGLKAVFCYGAGTDQIVGDRRIPPALPILRLIDPGQARRMLDHSLAAAFARLTRVDEYRALQARRKWFAETLPLVEAPALNVAVLGLGQIGATVATGLAKAGFAVRGWARTGRELPGVAVRTGADGFGATLDGADLLINILPSLPALHHVIGAAAMRRLGPGASIVNFGRGDHVDLDALELALDDHVGHAWLDVFLVEPLPPDHWAWLHPKVLVTPHAAGLPSPEGAARSLAAAIIAIRDGTPLPGVVRRPHLLNEVVEDGARAST